MDEKTSAIEYGQSEPEYDRAEEKKRMIDQTDIPVKDVQPDALEPEDTQCGIWCLKPTCMQPFASMFVFIPTLSLSLIATFAFGIYIMSQVTTLEKQFGITSAKSGLLLGANDVGYMLTILLWSHFAKKAHRPRLLALTSVIFGISGMLSVIPHFLMISEAGDVYDRPTTETSSAGAFNRRRLCLGGNSTTPKDRSQLNVTTAWAGDTTTGRNEDKEDRIRHIAFVIMFIAFGLQGICKAPKGPVTQTYLDDNVPKTKTGIYMGVTACLAFLGPVFGSIVGGIFSRMYVTLEETTLTPRDPRWIGAWWLGFLVFSSVAFVTSIPMALFPRKMPNAPVNELPRPDMPDKAQASDQYTWTKDKEMKKEFSIDQDVGPKSKKANLKRLLLFVKAFFASFLRLLQNPLYMMIVGCESVLFLTIAGRAGFFPKYLEQYFRVPMGKSSFFIGVVVMVPLGLGITTGGFLTHRLRLTIRGCMTLKWVTDGLLSVSTFLALIVMCDQPIIYGLSNPSDALKLVSPVATNLTCDTQCMCVEQDFLPSCGGDNRTYFSPCHAGCNSVLPNRDFGDCTCVPESPSFNQTVTPGYCEDQCSSLIFYICITFVGTLFSGLNGIPTHLTQLRCVQERDRSMSIGVSGLLRSLLGFFLGPIIFGRVVDSACILWSKRGSCSLYDADDLRIKMHVFTGGVLVAMLIVNGIAVLLTYKMTRYCKVVEWQRQGFEREREKRKVKKDKKKFNGCDIHGYPIKETDILV